MQWNSQTLPSFEGQCWQFRPSPITLLNWLQCFDSNVPRKIQATLYEHALVEGWGNSSTGTWIKCWKILWHGLTRNPISHGWNEAIASKGSQSSQTKWWIFWIWSRFHRLSICVSCVCFLEWEFDLVAWRIYTNCLQASSQTNKKLLLWSPPNYPKCSRWFGLWLVLCWKGSKRKWLSFHSKHSARYGCWRSSL